MNRNYPFYYENYACGLFLPKKVRPDFLSVLDVAEEIARVPGVAREELAGVMRLVWWRERIEDIYAGKRVKNHPVLERLYTLTSEGVIPKEYILELIAAQGRVVQWEPVRSLEEFQLISSSFYLPLLRLQNDLTGQKQADEQLVLLSRYFGASRMLVKWPDYLRFGKLILPESEMQAIGLDGHAVMAGNHKDLLAAFLESLAHRIVGEESRIGTLSKEFRPYQCMARSYLQFVQKYRGDNFAFADDRWRAGLVWRVLWWRLS